MSSFAMTTYSGFIPGGAGLGELYNRALVGMPGGMPSWLESGLTYKAHQMGMDALFPMPDPDFPGLGDLLIQSAEEGSPIIYAIGPSVMVSCEIIWMSEESPYQI